MSATEIELSLREFIAEDLMKDELDCIELSAELNLDSLDVTELRVFVEEKFSIDPVKLDVMRLDTLENIIDQVKELR